MTNNMTIKYRVWRKYENPWRENLFHLDTERQYSLTTDGKLVVFENDSWTLLNSSDFRIQYSTKKCDSTGKPIFENDYLLDKTGTLWEVSNLDSKNTLYAASPLAPSLSVPLDILLDGSRIIGNRLGEIYIPDYFPRESKEARLVFLERATENLRLFCSLQDDCQYVNSSCALLQLCDAIRPNHPKGLITKLENICNKWK